MIRQAERIIRPIIEAHERIRPLLEAHNRMMEICLPHTVEPPKYVVVQSVEYPDSRLQHEKQDGRKQRRIGFRLPDEPEPDDDEFQEHPPERRRIGF
jgi:hypothetical protein